MNTLFKHQLEIIRDDKPKTGLFLGTGSGKTLIALSLARGKTLVICPKTQKEDKNWERELKKNNLNVKLTVISKETFRRDHKELPIFDTIIVDECHTVLGVMPNIRWVKRKPRPKASQLFEALESFVERSKPSRLYLCTATIIRSPMTVWAAAKLLGVNYDFYKFRNDFYFQLPIPGREVWMAKNDVVTKNALASIVQAIGYTGQLSDYFDVPDQTYKTIWLNLSVEQKDRLRSIEMEFPEPIVLLGKKHQIENGVLSGDEYNKPESYKNAKDEKILELALEFPKMIIFAKYRAQIEHLKNILEKEKYSVITLTGDTKDRGEVIARANNMQACVFIVQAQVSAGWELPDYPVMVFASMSFSIVDRIQGEGRILRANALKKNLYIDLVVKGGIDEAVYNAIKNKKDFHERIYLKI